MDHAKLGWKIREQIRQFSGKVSAGLPKTARRLVREVLYGVQSRGSVLLSEIARSLEEKAGLKKRIERLGRQLGRPGLRSAVREGLLEQAAGQIDDQALLVIDPTDISKPCARKMEHLARVRDGSRKELRDGYWCCTVVAAWRGRADVAPLYQELYSQNAPGFVSENEELLEAIRTVRAAVGKGPAWVIDRGGDRREILHPLLDGQIPFLIRMEGSRHADFGRRRISIEEIAAGCPLRFRETVVREEPGKEKVYHLEFGSRQVRLPGYEQKLWLVVVSGFGEKPLMLLTTWRLTRSRKSHWRVVQSYLARWRVEETIRFIKQSYQLEDIRLLRYKRLQSMAALVMVAAYFACVRLGRETKLKILAGRLYQAAQRIYGIPEFRFYAIADGLKEILFGRSAQFDALARPDPAPPPTLPFGP